MENDNLYWIDDDRPIDKENSFIIRTNDRYSGCRVASDIASYLIRKDHIRQEDVIPLVFMEEIPHKIKSDIPIEYFNDRIPGIVELENFHVLVYHNKYEMEELSGMLNGLKNDLEESTIHIDLNINKLMIVDNNMANLNAMYDVLGDVWKILYLGPSRNVKVIIVNTEDNDSLNLSGSIDDQSYYPVSVKVIKNSMKDPGRVLINGKMTDKSLFYFNRLLSKE